jgi:hypothetical protein
VFRESIFPDFEINVPMPERGRFRRQPSGLDSGDPRIRAGGEKDGQQPGSA